MKTQFISFTAKTLSRKCVCINNKTFASLRLCGEKWFAKWPHYLRFKNSYCYLISIIFPGMVLSSCHKDHSPEILILKNGNLTLNMEHQVDGKLLLFDSLAYTTSLGQHYMVNDLQYFISGISLHNPDGKWMEIKDSHAIHYFDGKMPSTLQWSLGQKIPAGMYDSIAFIFGLDKEANSSNRFLNPPERDMFWPEILGGGYHYMKMNLKWKKEGMQETMPFMFHLGIGQMYSGNTANPDSIIGFIQNYFSVRLFTPVKIAYNHSVTIDIAMNVDHWFDGQNAFDFSYYPMGIMQSQLGMYRACMNGRQAFSVEMVVSD